MHISSEALKQDLDQLNREQLQQVAEFIAFLKFRDTLCVKPEAYRHRRRTILDPNQLAAQLAEFADEDRALAEAGMEDYKEMLHQEDML